MDYEPKLLHLLSPVFHTQEMQEAIDVFSSIWLEKHKPVENLVLYHYTSLNGLKGILKQRALWCGHISTLNDPLEIQHGQKVISDVVNEFIKHEENQDVQVFLKNLLVQVNAFGNIILHPFVFCFCESGDLLSQWRTYAESGGGYSLGFKFSKFTKISLNLEKSDDRKFPFLRKIIYDMAEQLELVKQYVQLAIDGSIKAFGGNYPHEPKYHAAVMSMQAANVLLDMLVSFKHNAFKEENEWRLVRVTRNDFEPENLKFREDKYGLIPYRQTYIFNNKENDKLEFPLTSIIYGPSLDPFRTRSAIELFLRHTASDNNRIKITPNIKIKGTEYKLK